LFSIRLLVDGSEIGLPWYSIYLFWLVLIVLIAVDNAFGSKQTKVPGKKLGTVKTSDRVKNNPRPNTSPGADHHGD